MASGKALPADLKVVTTAPAASAVVAAPPASSAAAAAVAAVTVPPVLAKKPPPERWRKHMIELISGGGSGAITKTACAPLERVKILFQIQGMHPDLPPKYHTIMGTLRTVLNEEGPKALFKGNGANVVRIIPNYALKFSFNDTFKEMSLRPGQNPNQLSFGQLMFSGSAAGLLQICATYPLELVRTRLSLAEGLSRGVVYNGIVDCLTKTVRTEGLASLYKGIGPTFLSGVPYVGLQMTFYELFKRALPGPRPPGTPAPDNTAAWADFRSPAWVVTWKLTAGALSGVAAQTITYPGDTVRRRMQTNGLGGQMRVYDNSWDALRKIIAREGAKGLYKGLIANTVKAVPGASIQFASYDIIKSILGLEDTHH